MRVRVSLEYTDEFGQDFSSHSEMDNLSSDTCVPFQLIEAFENAFEGIGLHSSVISDYFTEFDDDECDERDKHEFDETIEDGNIK